MRKFLLLPNWPKTGNLAQEISVSCSVSKVGGTTGDNCASAAKAAEAQHEIRFAHGLTQNHMWADSHFAPQNTLLLGNTLPLSGIGILCIPTHFPSQCTLLPRTLYSLAHFAPEHTLLPGTIYSMFQGAEWSRKQSLLRSKVI